MAAKCQFQKHQVNFSQTEHYISGCVKLLQLFEDINQRVRPSAEIFFGPWVDESDRLYGFMKLYEAGILESVSPEIYSSLIENLRLFIRVKKQVFFKLQMDFEDIQLQVSLIFSIVVYFMYLHVVFN